TEHNCINLRLPTHGGLYPWEFEKGDRELKVRVDGQLVFNGPTQMLNAALAGLGLAYVPQDLAQPYLDGDLLTRVLEDWCPPYSPISNAWWPKSTGFSGRNPSIPNAASVSPTCRSNWTSAGTCCGSGEPCAKPEVTRRRRMRVRPRWSRNTSAEMSAEPYRSPPLQAPPAHMFPDP